MTLGSETTVQCARTSAILKWNITLYFIPSQKKTKTSPTHLLHIYKFNISLFFGDEEMFTYAICGWLINLATKEPIYIYISDFWYCVQSSTAECYWGIAGPLSSRALIVQGFIFEPTPVYNRAGFAACSKYVCVGIKPKKELDCTPLAFYATIIKMSISRFRVLIIFTERLRWRTISLNCIFTDRQGNNF